MRTEDALLLLGHHQSRILAQIDIACALVAGGPQAGREPLARSRWLMARMLRAYQLFKHVEIFDPAIAHGDAMQVAAARRMKANCVAAGESYAAYVTRWSACDVGARWADYRPAMLAMAKQLRSHVARERRDVAHFLDGLACTRRIGAD